MEEKEVPEGYLHLPVGGTREIGSHKGFGLAMMIELLTSTLSGGSAGPDRRAEQAHHFLAYRVDAFTDLDQFKDDVDVYLKRLRTSKTAPGEAQVYYAKKEYRNIDAKYGKWKRKDDGEWIHGISTVEKGSKKSVLIKTKLNHSWIFESESRLTLEDSIYINDGKRINKTKTV